jgi:hypothetical protein
MLGQIKSSERADNFKVECPIVIRRGLCKYRGQCRMMWRDRLPRYYCPLGNWKASGAADGAEGND